jgi:Tol biopolymer transport system component
MVIDPFQLPKDISEIYLFDLDGHSIPITNIADAFGNNNEVIESFNWSPDGTKIAFTYYVSDFKDEHIAVVNVSTGQTVDFCLPSIGLLPPMWSPDGNKIAFASGSSTDQDRTWKTTILDIVNEYAVQVADTMLPLGWMESP